jgi:hypothetical protein
MEETTTEVAATEGQVETEVVTETPVETPPITEVDTTDEIVIPPPKKQTAQERINEVTRLRRQAERERDEANREVERLRQSRESHTETSDRPQLQNFETQEAYEDALFDWRDKRTSREREVEQRRKSEETALEKFNEKAKKLKEIYEDFDEIVEQPVFSPVMRETLLNSDEGAMVSYFLGRPENHAIADKISRLTPQQQIYELGKLETKLILAQKTKRSTDAPPPITTVGITGSAVVDESKMSDAEWVAMDRKRTAENKIKPKYGG